MRRPINDAAFSALSPDSSYWLGWLLADGCVRAKAWGGRVNTVHVGLARRDRAHLEKFRAFLGSTNAITDYAPTLRPFLPPGPTGSWPT